MMAFLPEEALMDNRLNRIRKEMNVLRVEMLRAEDAIRDQVNRDLDCTESAQRLMAMRASMTALVREWTRLGGLAHLPTVEERLKEKRGRSTKARVRYAKPSRDMLRRRPSRRREAHRESA
jgi:hypothetical protein